LKGHAVGKELRFKQDNFHLIQRIISFVSVSVCVSQITAVAVVAILVVAAAAGGGGRDVIEVGLVFQQVYSPGKRFANLKVRWSPYLFTYYVICLHTRC